MDAEAYREMAETEGRHWWFTARRRITTTVLSSLRLPARARVLEFGSGTGGNLGGLQSLGEVTALEPDPWARQFASEQHPRVRFVDSLEALGDERFDVVVMLDVLEHLDDPVASLRDIRRRLAPGAPLVLTVPAHAWLFGAHDRFLHHRRRYDRAVLESHLAQAGFAVSYLSAMNAVSFLPAVAMRAREALETRATQSRGMGVPPRLLNALLESFFAAERHVIPRQRLPLGLSWIAIAYSALPATGRAAADATSGAGPAA